MTPIIGPKALVLADDASVVHSESGAVHCRVGARLMALDGADPEVFRSIFDACDGVRDRDQVLALISVRHGTGVAGAVIDALITVGALRCGPPMPTRIT